MKTAQQRALEFCGRLDRLVLDGRMTQEKRRSYMEHINASLQYGEAEIGSHEKMTDNELCE